MAAVPAENIPHATFGLIKGKQQARFLRADLSTIPGWVANPRLTKG
jgi:hypothetical protein